MGFTCLQNNNAQQTSSFHEELEPISHREPCFGPILPWATMFLSRTWAHLPWGTMFWTYLPWATMFPLKDLGPFAQRKLQLAFSLGKLRKLPILLRKVASLSLFEKKLAYEVAQRLHPFFPLKMRIWRKKKTFGPLDLLNHKCFFFEMVV